MLFKKHKTEQIFEQHHLLQCCKCNNSNLHVQHLIKDDNYYIWIKCVCGNESGAMQTYGDAATDWNKRNIRK